MFEASLLSSPLPFIVRIRVPVRRQARPILICRHYCAVVECVELDASVEGGLTNCGARPRHRRVTLRIPRKRLGKLHESPVFKGYWFEMVAVVPSNLFNVTVNGSLYVFALSLRKLSATASPSSKEVSLSLRQWMPAWIP